MLYDHLLFTDKPDLSQWLNRGLRAFNAPALYPNNIVTQMLPPKTQVQELAASVNPAQTPLVMLDLEHWPMPAGVWNLVAVAEWFKAALPVGAQFGFYSMAPKRDYWRAIQDSGHGGQVGFEAWQAENDAMRPLADVVDVLFPSIYTFYPDRSRWVTYARANMDEAVRLANGKPVIPYLWMYYHNQEANPPLAGSYWRLQLDTVNAAGHDAVLWGGYQQPWSSEACWWNETKEFVDVE